MVKNCIERNAFGRKSMQLSRVQQYYPQTLEQTQPEPQIRNYIIWNFASLSISGATKDNLEKYKHGEIW